MAIVIRSSDRIKCKIEGIELALSPLNFHQKAEISGTGRVEAGEFTQDTLKQTFLAVKYAVKDVKGLECMDGEEYKVELDENGVLKDECVEDLLNMSIGVKLMAACSQLVLGVTEGLQAIEGVEIDLPAKKKSKKK